MVICVCLIWTFSILKQLLKCFVGPETIHYQSCRKTDTQFISVCLDYALRIVKGSGGNDRMVEIPICIQCFKGRAGKVGARKMRVARIPKDATRKAMPSNN